MLPEKITEMLNSNQICCLGTVSGEEPYLSLMIFTFVEDEDVLIMSSRADSIKVRNVLRNPRAALLIHEDEQLENPISMTLNGTVRVEAGERADKYRNLHQQAHPQKSQFIAGEGMAVLTFIPQRAVLADRRDRVTHWER